MSQVMHTNAASFAADVLQSDQPVLVDVFATWCPPCKLIAPILDELSAEFAGRVKIIKVNIDDSPEVASKYQVQGVPTLIGFAGGREVSRLVGAAPEAALRDKLNHLATVSGKGTA